MEGRKKWYAPMRQEFEAATARAIVGRRLSSEILHAGKIFLVFLYSFPHLRQGVSLGDEPCTQDWRDFPYISSLEPVEPHPIDFRFARCVADPHLH